ncbi:hypothetical protein TSTA_052530 [Talaromyces stipitatus ATCC 10500]|uniref:Fungal N-terminal domain-containing protein n=1 Tax=Talaromyces stipitatus (strain ATCC 10500 / CBS 375.48 / QM 6759 / NRRL 1006) TaxID=441959 RepID=B8MQT4_TALSN|nr:uncharacterized protein TSTA_052530 [Talaromyces stipitatus ATCC 10500]EED12731.1 hypothetical protein TSTA_052530 [Talaromyces stipitatus ATCC 10500]
MSFGFSPGDIALFLGFATKVVKALKEAGGSRSEYCHAQQQCEGFLMVMDDVQRLDLSNVSDSFRSRIEEYSAHTQEFVKDFKRTIVKYEKSMGKSSHRGFITSAPKKVQWAFSAADDLEKFRQSLSSQVNLVQFTISNAILSIVAKSNQPQQLLLGPARRDALSKAIYPDRHEQGYLDWNYNLIDSLDMLGRVNDITDLVYERLLTRRPGLLLADHGRIYTIPDDVSISVSYPPLNTISHGRTLPSTGHLNEVSVLNQHHVQLAHERTYSVQQNTLASEINEYLRSLNLEELSEREAEQVNQMSSQRLLLNEPEEESSEPLPQKTENNRDQPQPSGSDEKQRRKSKFHHRMSSFGFPMDALSGASLAIGITQFIASAAKQRLGWDIIQESQVAIREVENILNILTYRTETGWQKYMLIMRIMIWESNKKRVLSLLDEIESLKSTFSIVLQTHQIQISERRFAEIQYAREIQMKTLETQLVMSQS